MNPYDNIYNEKLGELIKDVPYNIEHIIDGFNTHVINALSHNTDISLSCTIEEFERVFLVASESGKWFMPEMFVAIEAVKSIPLQKSLFSELKPYIDVRKELNDMQAKWNEIAAPYMAEARKFAEDKAKRDAREIQSKQKLVALNGRSLSGK